MADIKLFRVSPQDARELEGRSATVEKSLQTLIEKHLETFFGIRFLASEHSTGRVHSGRIDTLGIDENGYPVIIEYKRALNENIINQGLFYLDWLMDHKADFELLVQRSLGQEVAESIEWSAPRVLCIAGDFTRYDEHAVQQIEGNIELIRYRRYGEDLLLFELVNAPSADLTSRKGGPGGPTFEDLLGHSPEELRDLFEALRAFLSALGDDVQMKTLKHYAAFKRLRNFACVEIHPQASKVVVYVKVDPRSASLEPGFTRDVSDIGHFGTGDLEITIRSELDLERAKPLLIQSYETS